MKPTGMTLIVKTITDFVVGFIVVFGAYIVLYGHITPGGGFAGGVIVACAFILVMLAQGRDVAYARLGQRTASILDSAGALAFLIIAWSGVWGGYFFMNILVEGDALPAPELGHDPREQHRHRAQGLDVALPCVLRACGVPQAILQGISGG